MNIDRMNYILNNDEKFDIFYENRPIWVQELNSSKKKKKIGFVDNFEERDVFIKDLYEN